MQLNPTNLATIFIASSHFEIRNDRVAPTGYAFSLCPGEAVPHWGFGGARDTQEMLAQGLNRAAELAFINDEDAAIDVIVRTLGVQKYLTEFLPKWRPQMASNPGFSRNNLEVWERLHNLSLLGNLKFRLPATAAEKQIVEDMQQLAKDAASRAHDDFRQNYARYTQAGVFETDEDELTAKAS
jgi:hypothetical protein